MNSNATSQSEGLGWQSVAGDPWFLRSSFYPESDSTGYVANCWVGLEGWTDGEGLKFDAGGLPVFDHVFMQHQFRVDG